MQSRKLLALLYLTSASAAVSSEKNQQLPRSIASVSQAESVTDDQTRLLMDYSIAQLPIVKQESRFDCLTLADVLPRSRGINIFASLTRDVATVSERLMSTSANTTLLAPLNSAMQQLPRKPWEVRGECKSLHSETNDQSKAARNLECFVEQHAIPTYPWSSGKENMIHSLSGVELWWEDRDGQRIILPDAILVDKVLEKVSTGEVWAIKGVVGFT